MFRKLPIEPITSMTQLVPTTCNSCSEQSINNVNNHDKTEFIEQISSSTVTSLETMTTTTIETTMVTSDCIRQENNHHIDNDGEGGSGANDISHNTLNVNNIVQDENNNHEQGHLKENTIAITMNTNNENNNNHMNDKFMYEQDVLTVKSSQMPNMDNQWSNVRRCSNIVVGDKRFVNTPFVPSGSWSPGGALLWNHGFPTPLRGPSVSTNVVKAPNVRFSSSQFRKQE
ncbi:unnamed protein product [Schistosoma mattheei]|uniref:Uncharacterized protein n=1 Tax=Schistosoma mattheei TaxID=31246 RepID=A0A183PHP0_9TREM|nr:unnamed protein product [Schistosoma mattheei]